MKKYEEIEVTDYGFKGKMKGTRFEACFSLHLISLASGAGCSFEDLADGYGAGNGTHGDWSGIRDSSNEAVNQMLERALNHLFS